MARTRSERARSRVLDEARDLLNDVGVDGFTVDAVARRSGVAKTTIYRHFDTGNDLMLAALDCMMTTVATPNTGSLTDDLIAFWQHLRVLACDPGRRQMILGVLAASASDPGLRRIHETLLDDRMTPLRTIVDLAKARGEIDRDLDVATAIDLIDGPFYARWLVRAHPPTDDDVRALVPRIVASLTAALPTTLPA